MIEQLKERETLLLKHWEKVLTNPINLGASRYKHISTMDVVKFFRAKNWIIRELNGGNMFSTHTVRMSHPEMKVGEDHLELVISNSYDRRTKLKISLGVYRLVCSNGLMVGETFFSVTQKHIGQNIEQELENKYDKIVAEMAKLSSTLGKLKTLKVADIKPELFSNTVEKLAVAAVGEKKSMYKVDTESLLKPQRDEDAEPTLWNVLNIVQEKVMNGGVPYSIFEEDKGKEVLKNKKTKARTNIYHGTKLNVMVFEEFIKLAA